MPKLPQAARCSFRWLAAVACLWLTACATQQLPSATPPPHHASLSGRLSVRVASLDDTPGHSLSALFDLHSTDGTSGELELSSPLGTLLGRAQWSPQHVRLSTADGDRDYPSLNALSQDLLGEQVPVQALFDWLHGRPWPGAPSEASPGPTIGFTQIGWIIKLDRMAQGVIIAERPEAPSITVLARLLI